jgi:hypothetical protein
MAAAAAGVALLAERTCEPMPRRVPQTNAEDHLAHRPRPGISAAGCPSSGGPTKTGPRKWRRSFPWSFRHTRPWTTRPHQLDGPPDVTSENGTLRDGLDGGGSTSNP